MKKRIISLALVLILAISIIPASAYASEIGDYSLLELIPDVITPGFPSYATEINIGTGFFIMPGDIIWYFESEVLENPIGSLSKLYKHHWFLSEV